MADVIHRDMVDSELHETKGAQFATANHVLAADGAGSATFVDITTVETFGVEEAPLNDHLYARRNAEWRISPSDPNVLQYRLDAAGIVAPPANREYRYNNATQSTATELYFDKQDQSNREVGEGLLGFTPGDLLTITNALNLSHNQKWTVDTVTDGGNYVAYGVTFVSAIGGDFLDTQDVLTERTAGVVVALKDAGAASGMDEGKSYVVGPAGTSIEREFRSTYGIVNHYAEVLGAQVEDAMVWTEALSLTENYTSGDYDVTWTGLLGTFATTKTCEYRVLLNGLVMHYLVDSQGSEIFDIVGKRRLTLGGNQTISLEFRAASAVTTAVIDNVTLTVLSV